MAEPCKRWYDDYYELRTERADYSLLDDRIIRLQVPSAGTKDKIQLGGLGRACDRFGRARAGWRGHWTVNITWASLSKEEWANK